MADNFNHPIDIDNESIILANAIKSAENREVFMRLAPYDRFRVDAFKAVAWGITETIKAGLELNLDAILLKAHSCPIRTTVEYDLLQKLVTNFNEIPLKNYKEHLEKLNIDLTKQRLIDWMMSSLYPCCTNSRSTLGDIDLRLAHAKGIIGQGFSASKLGFKTMEEVVSDYDNMKRQGIDKRTSGFFQLDSYLTEGLKEGQITTVAALSSAGKSSFVLSMMKNLGQAVVPVPTAQFALEMNNMSLFSKLLAFQTKLPISTIVTRPEQLSDLERQIYEHEKSSLAKNKFIFLNDNPSQSVASIREQTMLLQDRIKQQYIVVVVDLFGKIRDFQSSDNFARDYEKKLNEIQIMVRELGIHMILVAQINREVGRRQRRPTMNDLKNAHALTEISDIILGIHRPNYDSEKEMKVKMTYGEPMVPFTEEDEYETEDHQVLDDPDKNIAEVIIMKQRMGQKDVFVNFIFDPNTTCFYPVDDAYQHRLNQRKFEAPANEEVS